jgi:SAM-dependent methyltransferase
MPAKKTQTKTRNQPNAGDGRQNSDEDWETNGERQVSPSIDGIRRDHVARYEWAAELVRGLHVVDCACGIGYGSKILANEARRVTAIDRDENAIAYGCEHYGSDRIAYFCRDVSDGLPRTKYDTAVSFETIEHLENPEPFLRQLAKKTNTLIASVPNELIFPYDKHIKYHFRHYTPHEFEELLNSCGWQVNNWYGQLGPESEVEPNVQGRTLIAVCSKKRNPKGGKADELPAVKLVPNSVAIVAMGRSSATYLRLAAHSGGRHRVADETWAINSMGGVIAHDLLFHMDDCKIQEKRAARDSLGNIGGMLKWLRHHPQFITSRAYPDYPGAIEFPLEDFINKVGVTYLNNTVAYAVAYAIYIGVKKISLYGADYSYPDLHKAESGRGCVEFLLGLAAARGIQIEVAQDSTLLDAEVPESQRFYGYDTRDVKIDYGPNGAKVTFTERKNEDIPTASEMERRYKHE